MRPTKVLFTCAVLASLVVGSSLRADAETYTIHFAATGPTPSSINAKVGDVINWDDSFAWTQRVTVTDPTGRQFVVVDDCCPADVVGSFKIDKAGNYSYEDDNQVASGKYNPYFGSISASAVTQVVSLDMDSLNFGAVDIGSTVTKNITLTNSSANKIAITTLSNTDDSYSLDNTALPLTLQSGESRSISVMFRPKIAGTFMDTLALSGSGNTLMVNLQGIGKSPFESGVQGNNENAGWSMAVSPNPGNGTGAITINANKSVDVHLSLFDAAGAMVHDYQDIHLASGEYGVPLSLANLPSGEYHLRATSRGETVLMTKVLIIH